MLNFVVLRPSLLLLLLVFIRPGSPFTATVNPAKLQPTTSMSSSALSAAARHVGKLSPATSCLLLCDIQERFSPLIYKTDTVVSTAQFLTSVGKALDIPIVATQQYTKYDRFQSSTCAPRSRDRRGQTDRHAPTARTPNACARRQTRSGEGRRRRRPRACD